MYDIIYIENEGRDFYYGGSGSFESNFIVAVSMIALLWFIFIVYSLIDWNNSKQGDRNAKMKFSQWLDLYTINEKAWELCPYGPRRRIPYTYVDIVFSFFDYLRYTQWYDKQKKKKESKKMDKNLVLVLEAAQEDIDRIKKQVDDEMKSTAEQVNEVSERVKAYSNAPLSILVDDAKFLPPQEKMMMWEQ